jgi:DNA-binding winged helix-turn-helix (wHTH) protein
LRGGTVLYLFAQFALDDDRRELRGAGIVPIEPQVFDLLVYLIKNRNRVVSKDDLITSVWSGRVVSDSTLDSRINAVRKAFGDSGREQKGMSALDQERTSQRADHHVRRKSPVPM